MLGANSLTALKIYIFSECVCRWQAAEAAEAACCHRCSARLQAAPWQRCQKMADVLVVAVPACREVVALLRELKREATLLVVSHDLADIAPLVDCAWRMQMGGRMEPVQWPPDSLSDMED